MWCHPVLSVALGKAVRGVDVAAADVAASRLGVLLLLFGACVGAEAPTDGGDKAEAGPVPEGFPLQRAGVCSPDVDAAEE